MVFTAYGSFRIQHMNEYFYNLPIENSLTALGKGKLLINMSKNSCGK